MRFEDARVGLRVRSHSDGFTAGWTGVVEEMRRGESPDRDVLFVRWDGGHGYYAVACRLCAPYVHESREVH